MAPATLSATSLEFDNTPVGSTSEKTLTVTNSGSAALTVGSTASNAMFTVSPASLSIETDADGTVTVTFAPTAEGPQTGDLTLQLDRDSYTTVSSNVALSGTGVAASNPTVTSITPVVAKAGDEVTIAGTNFSTTASENLVDFSGVKGTVTSATETELKVTVPAGARLGPISVTVGGLTASSSQFFLPTFAGAGGITTDSFADKVDLAVGSSPRSVSIGDLDGDGKPDLAAANFNASTVSVFRNTSSEGSLATDSFDTKVDLTTGGSPNSVAIGDLDGDGNLDLATANEDGTVSVHRNISSAGSLSQDSFAPKVDLTAGALLSVSIRDLDGDGKPDLATTDVLDNKVSVLRNTSSAGSLTFDPKVDLATASFPVSVSIGDLDGDGRPDLAVADNGVRTVLVFRNTSSAGSLTTDSFAPKVDPTAEDSPWSVSIGDLDGDGKPDLATANTNTVSVFRNTSSAGSLTADSFDTRVDLTAGNIFSSGSVGELDVSIGDLDGDGKPDLAVVNAGVDSVSVFRNTSSAGSLTTDSFAPKVDLPVGDNPLSVAIGDLDGDGKPDLAVVNENDNTVSVLHNQSREVSPPTVTTGEATDISTTGATLNATVQAGGAETTVTFEYGETTDYGETVNAEPATVTGTDETAVAAALSDLKSGTEYHYRVVAENSAGTTQGEDMTFTTASAPTVTSISPAVGAVGDEVTIAGTNFSTTASENLVDFSGVKGTVTSTTETELVVAVPAGAEFGPISVTVGGLTAHSTQFFLPTFEGEGGISTDDFDPRVDFSLGSSSAASNPWHVVMADFDGDGKLDLAIADRAGSITTNVSVVRNTSSEGTISGASLAAKVDFPVPGSPVFLAVGDLDGDGKLDLAIPSQNALVSVLRNSSSTEGDIAFDTAFTLALSDDDSGFGPSIIPTSVAIGDLDGDGKLDLAVATGEGTEKVAVFHNTSSAGSLAFADRLELTVGLNPKSVAIGDLDGDSKPDLAVANLNSVSMFPNTSDPGTLTFDAKVDLTVNRPGWVSIVDLDGDAKLDLVVPGGGTMSVFRSTSSGGSLTFDPEVDFSTADDSFGSSDSSIPLTIGDLDGDGKSDLAFANPTTVGVGVLRNTSTSGNLGFDAILDLRGDGGARAAAMGDLDGDGKPDLATITTATNRPSFLSVFRNQPQPRVSAPTATTSAASDVSTTGATLNATVQSGGADATVTFEYGESTDYGQSVDADPKTVSGAEETAVTAALTGLKSGTTYHYRVVAENSAGITQGEDITFTLLADVWTAANSGLPENTKVNAIAIDPSNPETVYAGTSGGGVFKTTDGGDSWAAADSGLPTSLTVNAIAIDPSSPVYAGTEDGVFKSTDRGGILGGVRLRVAGQYKFQHPCDRLFGSSDGLCRDIRPRRVQEYGWGGFLGGGRLRAPGQYNRQRLCDRPNES